MMLRIYYTGDLIIPDGSDTGVYGDPCEDGMGATVESGWVDPGWSLGVVRESQEDVRPDVWEPDDGPMIEWILERLSDRLNGVEVESAGESGTFYACDATGPYDAAYTGVSMMLAAHVEGASPEMLRAVCLALRVSA
jgi:hypothetical protein